MSAAYMRTGKMAEYIGRSIKWLKERKDSTFVKGRHYHQPDGEREPFWDVAAINEWIRNDERSEQVDEILKKVV